MRLPGDRSATTLGENQRLRTWLVGAIVAVLVLDLAVVIARPTAPTAAEAQESLVAATATTVPVEPTTVSAPALVPTTAASSTTTAPLADIVSVPPADGPWTLGPYRGLGVWVDVYDWTEEFTRDTSPHVVPDEIDRMAQTDGIQTLFIQTAHHMADDDVIEPDRLMPLIERAHENGMSVVAWYLPTLEDVDLDLRRLLAGASLGVDGLAVDIEARHVPDHIERNRRLGDLSNRLRDAVGDLAISAITPSAVHLQVVNPGFWPEFPWVDLAATYDAILPMAYFTIRRGDFRSGERYIAENIDRIRASTGNQEVPIHPIGGIADAASVADLEGMVRAATSRGVLGVSLYDWVTSSPAQWATLAPMRTL